jgi:hypothetical protein
MEKNMQEAKHNVEYQALHSIRGGYKFRWVLEYANGRVKRGGWNADTNDASLQAWAQSKSGLVRASIESCDPNRVTRRVVECPGADFCSFEWVYEGRIGKFGPVDARIIGMTILTRSERVTMLSCGKAEVNARPENESDNLFHYGAMP